MNFQPNRADRRLLDDIASQEIACSEIDTLTAADPFGIDDPCPYNKAGHVTQWFHKEIVCVCCSKVFWR